MRFSEFVISQKTVLGEMSQIVKQPSLNFLPSPRQFANTSLHRKTNIRYYKKS